MDVINTWLLIASFIFLLSCYEVESKKFDIILIDGIGKGEFV